MSDNCDRKTIAENDRFRLNDDRGIEWKPGTHGDVTPSDVAFLLIDAVMRLGHRLDAIESERRFDNPWRGIRELSVRIDEIAKRLAAAEGQSKYVYVCDPATSAKPHVFPHPLAGYDAEGRHIHSHALAKGKKIGRDERARDIVEWLCSIGEAQEFKLEQTCEGFKVGSVAEMIRNRFLMDDDRR